MKTANLNLKTGSFQQEPAWQRNGQKKVREFTIFMPVCLKSVLIVKTPGSGTGPGSAEAARHGFIRELLQMIFSICIKKLSETNYPL